MSTFYTNYTRYHVEKLPPRIFSQLAGAINGGDGSCPSGPAFSRNEMIKVMREHDLEFANSRNFTTINTGRIAKDVDIVLVKTNRTKK